MGYDFEIQYHPGLENKVFDAFFPGATYCTFQQLSILTIFEVDIVEEEASPVEFFQKVCTDYSHPKFSLNQDTLMYKGQLVITLEPNSKLIPAMLQSYHDSVMVSHLGFLRTYKQ